MEQAEAAQKEAVRLSREADETKKLAEGQIAQLNQREENLKKELAELQRGRAELAAAVENSCASAMSGCSRARAKTSLWVCITAFAAAVT